jgi:uncharacterized membrane protein YedE/YeeE
MVLREHRWWFIGNACAIALWLLVASQIWPWPPYEHCDFAPGDPSYFFFLVLPLLVVAAVVQLSGLIAGIVRCARHKGAPLLVAALVTTLAWGAASAYDFYRAHRFVTDDCALPT